MKKIVQRTRRFEKRFKKLVPKLQKKFITKLKFFLDDEFHPSLDTHKLKGKKKGEMAFSLTGDVRAIYRKEMVKGEEVIAFTFIDVGTHNVVY
jgi:mRNA-degrading endonuclease YafQ of YafQ-DinJ toxin-antitoxin module